MLRWYPVHTISNHEKKVALSLRQQGIESYCPLNRVYRRWSDRLKLIETPLFKGLVFVRITDDQRTLVRTVDGVINFGYRQGKTLIIRDSELRAIRRFLSRHSVVSLVPATTTIHPANGFSAKPLSKLTLSFMACRLVAAAGQEAPLPSLLST